MDDRNEALYELVRHWAIQFGLDEAIERYSSLGIIDAEMGSEFRTRFQSGVDRVGKGGPVIKVRREGWYPGAQDSDPTWKHFKEVMEGKGRGSQIPSLHEASDTIAGLTPDPAQPPYASKGLVVGFIQSGKTTNFTAVAAKLADRDYRMVIVLAGIHNALRKQTQDRLREYLVPEDSGRWFVLTGSSSDFDLSKLNEDGKGQTKHDAPAYLNSQGKTSLLVVKKNHVVLTKLLKWLSEKPAKNALKNQKVLIIDDEADQASVATRSINPLIRRVLQLMPRSTYIGYTATPFANVFIDPHDEDDLYPRDFIYPLPKPEGYFGPEVLFGRDVLELDSDDVDGYDMIRKIPEEEEYLYRPRTKDEEDSFIPVMTAELMSAISWFLLATAARWKRGDRNDSSMLIHTSFKTKIHDSYRPMIEKEIARLTDAIENDDSNEIARLREQWGFETSRVPASDWERELESFENLLEVLPSVLRDVRIVIDNSASEDRLDYDSRSVNTVIAIGGNTLSRGITLEGLVSSVFLRPTNTYDTLLQMGRWFGFRTGYEDLPRIWTTDSLRRSFRHLALVEHEMRSDMEMYELQGSTPMDVAVRIRTHPTLRVTAKMGAAAPARTSYSGARLQVRFYRRSDEEWLENNWAAGEALIHEASRHSKVQALQNGSQLFTKVPVSAVLKFLDNYKILPDQADINAEMLEEYITNCNAADRPQLTQWNVAVVAGEGSEVELGELLLKSSIRAPLKDSEDIADIKTLMSKQDLVIDMPDVSTKEAKKLKEAELKLRRIENEETKDRGLLVLYPIDPHSAPVKESSKAVREEMNAPCNILGLALVFPKSTMSDSERDSVQSTHVSVDVSEYPEDPETDKEIFEENK